MSIDRLRAVFFHSKVCEVIKYYLFDVCPKEITAQRYIIVTL